MWLLVAQNWIVIHFFFFIYFLIIINLYPSLEQCYLLSLFFNWFGAKMAHFAFKYECKQGFKSFCDSLKPRSELIISRFPDAWLWIVFSLRGVKICRVCPLHLSVGPSDKTALVCGCVFKEQMIMWLCRRDPSDCDVKV